MNNVTISTNPRRAARMRVFEHLAANNPGRDVMSDFIVQPYVLKLMQQVTSRTEYRFDLYEEPSGQQAYERRLNRNDAFFMSHMGLGLLFEDTTALSPVPISNSQVRTFPDPVIFAGAGEAVALEAFYNAQLTIKTDPIERITDFDTNILRYLPLFDQPNAWGPSLEERGYFELAGEVIFDGAQNNTVQLSLNADADISAAVGIADQRTWIVVMLFGNLVLQGARKVGQYM